MKKLKVGNKVRITFSDKQSVNYVVAARDERYVIFSDLGNNWFNYCIADVSKGIIGTDNRIFSTGYESYAGCQDNLDKLSNGELNISSKNNEPLSGVLIEEEAE